MTRDDIEYLEGLATWLDDFQHQDAVRIRKLIEREKGTIRADVDDLWRSGLPLSETRIEGEDWTPRSIKRPADGRKLDRQKGEKS